MASTTGLIVLLGMAVGLSSAACGQDAQGQCPGSLAEEQSLEFRKPPNVLLQVGTITGEQQFKAASKSKEAEAKSRPKRNAEAAEATAEAASEATAEAASEDSQSQKELQTDEAKELQTDEAKVKELHDTRRSRTLLQTGEGHDPDNEEREDKPLVRDGARIAPFGKEDTGRELQHHAARTQDTLVDAIENAEVAEIKRSIFRSLTRLRAAEIKEFDTIARLETQAIDEYNDNHHYRAENPLDYIHTGESEVKKDKYTSFHD